MIDFTLGLLVGVFASPVIGPLLREFGAWLWQKYQDRKARQ